MNKESKDYSSSDVIASVVNRFPKNIGLLIEWTLRVDVDSSR